MIWTPSARWWRSPRRATGPRPIRTLPDGCLRSLTPIAPTWPIGRQCSRASGGEPFVGRPPPVGVRAPSGQELRAQTFAALGARVRPGPDGGGSSGIETDGNGVVCPGFPRCVSDMGAETAAWAGVRGLTCDGSPDGAGLAAVQTGGRGDVTQGRRVAGAQARGACTRPAGCGRRRCGARSSREQRPDSHRKCVLRPWPR